MPVNSQTPQNQDDFSIKVGVEEVRIDVTVLDKNGRQISDLTAKDFEVYQDGKPQKIISCEYITNSPMYKKMTTSPEASKEKLLLSDSILSRDDVHRTIAFIYSGDYYARMALQKFVESQMEPGDLITIIGAATGTGALQQFSSDKRELLSRIKGLPVHVPRDEQCYEGSYGHVFTVDASLSLETRTKIEARNRAIDLSTIFDSLLYGGDYPQALRGRIAPIRYGISALRDMPGRKYLILMSTDIYYDANKSPQEVERILDEAADEALRAKVVIFTLDIKGLTVCQKTSPFQQHLPLSKKTGGMIVENSNFFLEGIKPVQEALKGYYLLSYIPSPHAFDGDARETYHRIRVKAKRPESIVHTRDGFFSSSRPSNFAVLSEGSSLRQAIFSPFLHNDLNLILTSGYAYAPQTGYFLRSLIHLHGKDLTFSEEENGEHSLSFELMILTSDSNGRIPDSKGFRYDFRLKNADLPRIKSRGLDLITYLPARNPGKYYVRAGIKDAASGKIGSAYQFLDIPDLSNGRLSLSSIFVPNSGEDISFIKPRNMDHIYDSINGMYKWRAIGSDVAHRSYLPGESFDYFAVLYNADGKENQSHQLEIQTVLFKDGQIFQQGKPENINFNKLDDMGNVLITGRQALGSTIGEGSYLLQLRVLDKQSPEKSPVAIQEMDFLIRREPGVILKGE